MELTYREISPCRALQPLVYSYWQVVSDGSANEWSNTEYCFPGGMVEWIFTVRGKRMLGVDTHESFWYPQSILTGVSTRTHAWKMSGSSELFGVRLSPEAAINLFGTPIRDFSNSYMATEYLLGQEAKHVQAMLEDAETLEERADLMQAFLLNRLHRQGTERNYVSEALRLIRGTEQMDVEALSRRLYVSDRQLQRSFREQIGITPRTYHRMVRLFKAHALGIYRDISVSELSYEMGYADPAHFVREFRDYFGITPSQYFKTTELKYRNQSAPKMSLLFNEC